MPLRLLFVTIIILLLTGCAPANMPPYLVLITPALPGMDGGCSGVVVAPRQVLTAGHCVERAHRIVTVYGQRTFVDSTQVSELHDLALLTVSDVLWVGQYATFTNPALSQQYRVWGNCPFLANHLPRVAYYNGLADEEIEDMPLRTYSEWILPTLPFTDNVVCRGDSGGIVQDSQGRVVGIISGMEVETFFIQLGSKLFTVPTGDIEAFLAGEQGE